MNQTAQGQALLAAILDNPADDLRRLVYADWLEEEGQTERAEFIRMQVKLARSDAYIERQGGIVGAAAVQADRLRREIERQVDQGELPWLVPEWATEDGWDWSGNGSSLLIDTGWPRKFGRGPITLTWERGFIREVQAPLAWWLEHGSALVAEHPIERVEITNKQTVIVLGEICWTCPEVVPPLARISWEPESSSRLPVDLFLLLPDRGLVMGLAAYPSKQHARDALSQACLALARQRLTHR